ncbi:MAG: pyridoxal kinase [Candidatus Phaeomarinobacter sp.]
MPVLAISSQVVAGHVGNSAAQFVLQALGHEVWAVPTVLLSHHPGHGAPKGRSTSPQELENLLDSLWEGGWMDQVSGVMAGYFTSEDQIKIAAATIARLKKLRSDLPVLIDPIMGDEGAVYVADAVPDAIREQLMPLATITTPNLFELCVLTQTSWPMAQDADIAALARGFIAVETLVTSVPGTSKEFISSKLVTATDETLFETRRVTSAPNGVGDVTAAAYLALRLNGKDAPDAASAATEIVRHLVASSVSEGLKELPLVTNRQIIASIAEGT